MTDARKPMTKSQIVTYFSAKHNMPKAAVAQFLDDLAALAAREAKEADAFTLPGIGKVSKKDRKARKGRNPATGEAIDIPAKTVVKMRLSKGFQESVVPSKK